MIINIYMNFGSSEKVVRMYQTDFPSALKRLLANKILWLNNFSSVFYIFALIGYITFLPKYIETQFEQSASRAGMVNGKCSYGLLNATPDQKQQWLTETTKVKQRLV